MFDGVTRPLRALMVALRFKMSITYAYAVLALMDKLEAGHLTDEEFSRAGAHLGELYPEDYKRARGLFVNQGPKQ